MPGEMKKKRDTEMGINLEGIPLMGSEGIFCSVHSSSAYFQFTLAASNKSTFN